MQNNVIIIGASGHGKVIADIVVKSGDYLLGFLDDKLLKDDMVLGYPILGKTEDVYKFDDTVKFIIGIGNNYTRKKIVEKYSVNWHTAIHPTAVVAIDVNIGEGTVVMANTIINTSTRIGKHCILNSGAVVEHDNMIEDYVHVSPNACTGGTVVVGELTHIGIGSTVKNNVTIASDCVVGAGAVVVKDIIEKGVYVGVPAKKKQKTNDFRRSVY
ncbi:MAG: acetyltransferase [Oscillospiraceae bacterium]|jgi:sugar O-acyltransferase (sialic acid O-acetyltransferase NeuD family)|nr:acetyltransferase [Oscillospiraceae bacterium]